MRWFAFPDDVARSMCATVDGLPWFAENAPHVWRLPGSRKETFRPPVWALATNPSGGRIRFRTDATAFSIRVNYSESAGYGNMCVIGQMGFDLYTDGRYHRSVAPPKANQSQIGPLEGSFAENLEKRWREVTIYMPMYSPAEIVALGADDDARFEAPAPFAHPKPVVYYGSSITQGGCASRCGLTYQAILSRRWNLDFVNLGFSGNGMGDPEIASAMAEIDASCYVLDYAQNLKNAAAIREVYTPFMEIIRRTKPETPIVCTTPIYATIAGTNPDTRTAFEDMRQVIRESVAERIVGGDKNLRLVEGEVLLGPDLADGFVDGLHPNDLGFQSMADRLGPILAKTLGILK